MTPEPFGNKSLIVEKIKEEQHEHRTLRMTGEERPRIKDKLAKNHDAKKRARKKQSDKSKRRNR